MSPLPCVRNGRAPAARSGLVPVIAVTGLAFAGCAAGDDPNVWKPTCTDGQCTCGPCGLLRDGRCTRVGVRSCPRGWTRTEACGCSPAPAACKTSELPEPGGRCRRVGPDCPEGFRPGAAGCDPVADDCGPDGVPILGGGCERFEAFSRCGEGPWGDVPDLPGTVFVDPAAAPEGADGSRGRPYAALAAAFAAVPAGGTVALAEGTYGKVPAIDRPMRLRGRCADKVVLGQAGDFTDRGFGNPVALFVSDTHDVVIEGVTVKAPGGIGLYVGSSDAVELRDSRISSALLFGVVAVKTGDLRVTRCVIEGTKVPAAATGDGFRYGQGLWIEGSTGVEVSRSLVDENQTNGIRVQGSTGRFADCRVQGVWPNPAAVAAGKSSDTVGIRLLDCGASVVEGNTIERADQGIVASDSQVAILRNVVAVPADGLHGGRLGIASRAGGIPDATATVTGNLVTGMRLAGIVLLVESPAPGTAGGSAPGMSARVEDNTLSGCRGVGIAGVGGRVTVTRNAVDGLRADSESGAAIAVVTQGAEVEVADNAITNHAGGGLDLDASTGRAVGNLVRYASGDAWTGLGVGIGIYVSDLPAGAAPLRLEANHVAGALGAGIAVTRARVDAVSNVVDGVAGSPGAGGLGAGILVLDAPEVTVSSSVVRRATGAGIAVAGVGGATGLIVEESLVEDTAPLPDGRDGVGVFAQAATLGLLDTTVTRATATGVRLYDADAEIRRSVIADTRPGTFTDDAGHAVETADGLDAVAGAGARVEESVLIANPRAGVSTDGATCVIAPDSMVAGSQYGVGVPAGSGVQADPASFSDVQAAFASAPLPVDTRPSDFGGLSLELKKLSEFVKDIGPGGGPPE